MIHQPNESILFSPGGTGMFSSILIMYNLLSDPSSSQIFPQHVASTTESTESYDLLAAQQDENDN
jgi:hypothetical protein